MPAISNFIKAQKSKFIQAKKWLPWGYYIDDNDKKLCHPDVELLQLLDKVCKYMYMGATYDSAAKWLQHHATDIVNKRKEKDPTYNPDMFTTISSPGVKVLFRKWMKVKSDIALAGKARKSEENIDIKNDIDERFGSTVETVGFDGGSNKGIGEGQEDQKDKMSA